MMMIFNEVSLSTVRHGVSTRKNGFIYTLLPNEDDEVCAKKWQTIYSKMNQMKVQLPSE